MQPAKSKRLGHSLLALCSLVAVAATQSASKLPAGCYWTSTVIFGNVASLTASTSPSTTGDGQITISPILTLSKSSLSTTAPMLPPTSATPSPPSSSSVDTSVLLSSSTVAGVSITTANSASSSTTAPAPVSTPFRITVNGFNSRLRARALSYMSFDGNDAYLNHNEDLAAIFVLTSDGQLRVGEATIGTNGRTGSLPLTQFPGSIQPSGYTWFFNDTRLEFGENLPFSALSDGQMYVTFPGAQPPSGAVLLSLEPVYVETTTTSTSVAPTTRVDVSTTMAEVTDLSTSEALATTSSPSVYSAGTASSPGTSPATTPSPSLSSQVGPDRPLTSSTILHTASVLSSFSSSLATTKAVPSSSPQALGSSPSSIFIASTKSSAPSAMGVSSTSISPTQSTTVQVSLITQLSSMTRSTPSSVAFSSPASSASSSAAALSSSASSSATVAVSSGAPTSSSTTSVIVPLNSSAAPSTPKASTASSSQALSITVPTTTSPAQSTPSLPISSSSSILTIATTTSRSFTQTRGTSSTSTSPTFNPIPNPYPAKRGLAYRNVTTLGFYPPPSPYIAWSYNYYSLPNASDNIGPYPYPSSPYRFIPLLYNDAESLTSIWSTNVNFSIANYGTDAIFGFNEPDANFNGQSANMPVQQALTGYHNFMQPFAGRVKIGAPAVTNTGGGLTYLQQFLGNASQQNQNLTLDFINIHWYASPYNIDYFKSFLLGALNISLTYSPNITSRFTNTATGGTLPIWITEFGMDQNFYDISANVQFLKNASLWMDEQSWVERYAWFGNFPEGPGMYGGSATDKLLNFDGSGRSALGDVWYGYNGTN